MTERVHVLPSDGTRSEHDPNHDDHDASMGGRCPEPPRAGIVHRSIMLSAVDRYGNMLVMVVSTAVLARLLTPREFGMYAIVGAVTAITSASFLEFGGANYLIQKATVTEQDIRTVSTITVGLSLAIAALFLSLAGVLADFFSYADLERGFAVAAMTIAISPVTNILSALLRRRMTFGPITVCGLVNGLVTAVASIALAVAGHGFMAPVWGTLFGTLAGAAVLVAMSGRPAMLRPSLLGYRDVLTFGAYSGGTVVVNVLYNFLPQLVIGRVIDFAALGLYTRATNVTQVFDRAIVQVLTPVVMPAMGAASRAGRSIKTIYLESIALITGVHWPCLVVTALVADPLVRVWLGPQWTDTIPLVQMLCIGSLALFMAPLTYPVLVAIGRVRDTLLLSLVSLLPSVALLCVASFHGIEVVAAAAMIAFPFQAALALRHVAAHLDIRWSEVIRATAKSGAVTALCASGVAASMLANRYAGTVPIVELPISAVCAAVGWVAGLWITRHPLVPHASTMMTAALDMVPRRRRVVPST